MTALSLPELLLPAYYTKPVEGSQTRLEEVESFARTTMTFPRGTRQGQPITFSKWQRFVLSLILEEDDECLLRYRRFLLGLPRKNGKSLIGTVLALEALTFGTDGDEIYSAARDREQAKIVFGLAKRQVANSPILSKMIRPTRDVLENRLTGATYKALSADGMSAQGLAPKLVIADELHAWGPGRGEDLWEAITEGSADREEALVLAITTAGWNIESMLGKMYTHGKEVASGGVDDPAFGFAWWEADEELDITSPETWKKASPSLAEGILNMKDYTSSLALANTTSLNSFKRYKLNQWVRVSGEMYITNNQWGAAKSFADGTKIPKGAKIAVGFDGAQSDDSTGFVGIDIETGLIELLASWTPPKDDPDWVLPIAEVEDAKKRIFEEYKVVKLLVDPAKFGPVSDGWAKASGRRVVEQIPQSVQRLRPMIINYKNDLVSGQVGHSGHRQLSDHHLNAVLAENGKIYKDAQKSPRKIDFCVAALMANDGRRSFLSRTVSRVAF